MANRPPKVRPDDPILCDDHNALVDVVWESRVEHVDPPLTMQRGPAGTVLGLAADLLDAQIAKSGAGGIPARVGNSPGEADVTLYGDDGTTLTAGATVRARNLSRNAVAANAFLIVLKLYNGRWYADFEDCP